MLSREVIIGLNEESENEDTEDDDDDNDDDDDDEDKRETQWIGANALAFQSEGYRFEPACGRCVNSA